MYSLEDIKKRLIRFFESKPVVQAWIFGSYARGEENSDSDIDILVTFDMDQYPSLLTHSSMVCELEDIFNKKIDLVPDDCVLDNLRNSINRDKILVYETCFGS